MEEGIRKELGEEEDSEGFDHLQAGSFMELLCCGNSLSVEKGMKEEHREDFIFHPSSLSSFTSSSSTIQMLCFGGANEKLVLSGLPRISSESSLTTLSSSPSPTPKSKKPKTSRTVNNGGGGRGRRSGTTSAAATTTSRRTKKEAICPVKVRKEKLVAERIATLKQLFSPSAKLDTTTILRETLEYIKFLHGQVQILSSAYPLSDCLHVEVGLSRRGLEETREDLNSRGLCLVPVSCTAHVGDSNSDDIWSPPTRRSCTSSSSKH